MPQASNTDSWRANNSAPIPARGGLLRTWAASESLQAAIVLALLLNVFFFPFLWGNKTLLLSARGAPSIMPDGAAGDAPRVRIRRSPDTGAPAWQSEPWVPVMQRIYSGEHTVPLWNPYAGCGAPFAAAMLPQTFYPLTFLLSLHPTPSTFAIYLALRLWIAGFFTYLFLKLFVPHPAALAAGIAFMFTGYFILYLNMPHLSVEVMLPAVFYAFELLHRRFDTRVLVLGSSIVLLSILGGMPESTFLILVFGGCYFFLRAITDHASASVPKQIGRLALINIFGFGMAALLLVPFVEYVSYSFTSHSDSFGRGVEGPVAVRELLGYLAPLVEGYPLDNIFSASPNFVYGYFGVATSMLASLAVIGWIADRRSGNTGLCPPLVPFFAVAVAAMLMKRCGFPLVQWIGYLPVFRAVIFYKYLEPLIGFSVAVLCGMGVSRVLAGKCRPRQVATAVVSMLALLLLGYGAYLGDALRAKQDAYLFFRSTTAALLVLVVASVVLFVTVARGARTIGDGWLRRYFLANGLLILCCIAGELLLNFIYPVFYKYSEQPDKRVDAFAGAPYISWLQQKKVKDFRIFARESILFPEWAGVFGLFDIRAVDAMYPDKYFPFVRAFVPPDPNDKALFGDLLSYFAGEAPGYSFTSPAARRLLQLSSVRYLITRTPLEASEPLFNLVYDKDVRIYEYRSILPRAAIFYSVEAAATGEDALKRLADPGFDLLQRAVVTSSGLSREATQKIRELVAAPPRTAGIAEIVRQASREVQIGATLERPGLVVLNDTAYPGWRAYVDGREADILNSNYLFRGVLVEGGRHQVVFRYQPGSFQAGLVISLLALITLVLLARFPVRLGLA